MRFFALYIIVIVLGLLVGYCIGTWQAVNGCFLVDETHKPVITVYPRGQSYAEALETFNHEWAHYTAYEHYVQQKTRLEG